MNFKEGEVLYFDKPLRWTSFAVVNKIRYHISRKLGVKKIKVGHAGTLDPKATGLLIVCVGKATKQIQEIQDAPKEYIAQIKIGVQTESYDSEKPEILPTDFHHISTKFIQEKLESFIGEIDSLAEAKAKDDAKAVKWFNIEELPVLAFDHAEIIRDAIEKHIIKPAY